MISSGDSKASSNSLFEKFFILHKTFKAALASNKRGFVTASAFIF